MKKILFALSILTMLSYGCNRQDQESKVGPGAGAVEREEAYPEESKAMDANTTTPVDDRPDLEEEE